MGQIVGATNSKSEYPTHDPVTPQDLLATVYRHLGINYRHEFLNFAPREAVAPPEDVIDTRELRHDATVGSMRFDLTCNDVRDDLTAFGERVGSISNHCNVRPISGSFRAGRSPRFPAKA